MASDTLAKIDMARVVVAELNYGKREWKGLHEPASEDATDVVIMEALRCAALEIARLTRELEEARERERALREALMTISMRCYDAVMQTPLLEHQSMHALAGACKQDADAALAGQSALAVDSEVANGWRGSRE